MSRVRSSVPPSSPHKKPAHEADGGPHVRGARTEYPDEVSSFDSGERPPSDEHPTTEPEPETTEREARQRERETRRHEPPQGMVPGRERRRTKVERGAMRLIATGGVIGIAAILGAVLVGQDVAGWIVGLAVGVTSVFLAALLWSSRQL